jgi:small subunit ribosomal protein S21
MAMASNMVDPPWLRHQKSDYPQQTSNLRRFTICQPCASSLPHSEWRAAGTGHGVRAVAFVCSRKETERVVQVLVRDNNVDQALRVLKKKMQREGVFREMKLRRNYEKPSERRAREKAEAVRRYRKLMRKRMDREGY